MEMVSNKLKNWYGFKEFGPDNTWVKSYSNFAVVVYAMNSPDLSLYNYKFSVAIVFNYTGVVFEDLSFMYTDIHSSMLTRLLNTFDALEVVQKI